MRVETIRPNDTPNEEFTYFDIGGIDNQYNKIDSTSTIIGRSAPSRARLSVRKDDILFSTVRTYLKNIAYLEKDYPNPVASTGFTAIRPAKGVVPRFVFLQVLSDKFLEPIHSLQSGSSYPAVRESDVFAQPFLLPPSAEQERISAKLSASLLGIERAERATRRALERLHHYRAAVLHEAVTGELTKLWREARQEHGRENTQDGKTLFRRLLETRRNRWEEAELKKLRAADKPPGNDNWKNRYSEPIQPNTSSLPVLPKGWTWVSISQLSWASGYGTSVKCSYEAKGPLVLRIPNVRSRELDFQDAKFAASFQEFDEEDFVTPGDMLLIRTNGSRDLIGRAAIIKIAPMKKCGFASYLIRFRIVGDEALWSWLSLTWDSDVLRSGIESRAVTTAGQYNVSVSRLADLAIPLPPNEEMAEIVKVVESRLLAADLLAAKLEQQLTRAREARDLLLHDAFTGQLVDQDPTDEPATILLDRIRTEQSRGEAERKQARQRHRSPQMKVIDPMQKQAPSSGSLIAAWERISRKTDARTLFDEAGFGPEQIVQFYEVLRATPLLRTAFKKVAQVNRNPSKAAKHAKEKDTETTNRFRLVELWLEDFKNLKDYTASFDSTHGLDVLLGWNGTGKSNFFEALVIILRDLHEWWEKNRWPDKPMNAYRLVYEMDSHIVEITWRPSEMKRPELRRRPIALSPNDEAEFVPIKRDQLPLPRFVFGYYSGPTNRLAEHFLPMKQAHYVRLREAKADDARTLAKLLQQRRFFCAETHHAKYVLLAFSYKKDRKISAFLKDRLRIVGFESALFVIRKPRWAKPGSKATEFWGATGIMRRVMERLRRYAIAPMVLEQTVSYGYRSTTEDHYYFFLPDSESLHSFAAEYEDARTFFLALESTDFSELIHDVKIQVRIEATNTEKVPITFHQLSEGEQQLLMVLGLMRFTKSHQSLVLLDEPDTHLNPHWSVDYLKDITRVMSDNELESPEQQSSQILMATHDPLVIASLVKEQIHLLKRVSQSGTCAWTSANVNPRGLGFTGILTSEMFGFRSDLDPETLADLDSRVRLVAKEEALTVTEKLELEQIDMRLTVAGFSKAFSDPYYAAFVRAWGRRHSELMAGEQFLTQEKLDEIDRIASQVLKEAIAEVEKGVEG